MVTTVYLIRHAQAEGNLYRRCQGWNNGLITKKGREQIDLLEKRFEGVQVDAVYSSDLFRTMTTASSLTRSRKLPLRTDPGLREIGCGIREDHPWGEWMTQDPDNLQSFLKCDPTWSCPGSETFPQVQERMVSTMTRIAASHPGQTIAMFSHGCAIRTAVTYWRGVPVDQIVTTPLGDNTCVAKLEFEDGVGRLIYFNDNSHLDQSAWQQRAKTPLSEVAIHFEPFSFPASLDPDHLDPAVADQDPAFLQAILNAEMDSGEPLVQGDNPVSEDQQMHDVWLYLAARRDGWQASHGTMKGFQGAEFLRTALSNSHRSQDSVLKARIGNALVGVLQMDYDQEAGDLAGRVPFLYMTPAARGRGLGAQLVGQAISAYRKLNRRVIRLRCAPENDHARRFYEKMGFAKIGEVPGGSGVLYTMEKYIGPEL